MKKYLPILSLFLFACSENETTKNLEKMQTDNPFLITYSTPFEVPPFDEISLEHFKVAFEKGIEEQENNIALITSNPEAATFANTIEALEISGETLTKVSRVFYNLNSANTNEDLQALAKEISPMMSAHSDNIALNEALFKRIETIYNAKDSLDLTPEQLMLLEKKYKNFVRGGAILSENDKERLRAINESLSMASLQFGQNALAATNNYELIVETEDELAGLPKTLVESAAKLAKEKGHEGKYLFNLQYPSVMPFLTYADNRNLREEIWNAFRSRGKQGDAFDNRDLIKEMVSLRDEKAKLLGYSSHVDYVLENRMAKKEGNVLELLDKLWEPAIKAAEKEEKMFRKLAQIDGIEAEIAPWDWRYYEQKLKEQMFDLNDQEVMEYFSLDNVREGIFMVCNKLFGLQFKKLDNVPLYHEEVSAYEVLENNGKHVGVLYMDMHPRESKRGGAWMTSFRSQTTENNQRKAPVISIVCNFSRPTENAPALLNFDEVTTFFHEFGHALHGLLSNVTYPSLAGTSVPTDFVELPSQLMENWATDPEVMKMYAKHYQTNEVIPDELIVKLSKSATYGQGFATVEYLASSYLDIFYHNGKNTVEDVVEFENKVMSDIGLIPSIIPRHSSTYFNHIFAGGYSAGYYSYIWSGVLDTDAFEAFKETALFDANTAKLLRENILEKGGTEDPMSLYVKFRGQEPSITPLLRKRGLL